MPASPLSDTSLIRRTYRTLLRSNRSYAAFTDDEVALYSRIADARCVLDPMSGYGSTTQLAAANGQGSLCIEVNEPQYLWQYLTSPAKREVFIDLCASLLGNPPTRSVSCCATVSEAYFPPLAWREVSRLQSHIADEVVRLGVDSESVNDVTDAIILPFVARLACLQPSQNPSHVKDAGGICVFEGWVEDFDGYLRSLQDLLRRLPLQASSQNVTVHGDAKQVLLEPRSCDALFTSPPYPNRSDYASMFRPELHYLHLARGDQAESLRASVTKIIGTVAVGRDSGAQVRSQVAYDFIDRADAAAAAKGSQAESAQRRYYRPYFEAYFAGLEAAWLNVGRALTDDCRGMIFVVDNTHRGIVVPVADFVVDCWSSMGFHAEVARTVEGPHFGTQNPAARGVRAVHSRHVVSIQGRVA